MTRAPLVCTWALVRRNELPDLPGVLDVHPDFASFLPPARLAAAFRAFHALLYRLMTGLAETPEKYGMPLTDDGVRYGDPKAQEARYAAFWPMELLYALLRAGSLDGSALRVDGEALRAIRFKRTAGLLEAWRAQGFVFTGLKNGRFDPAVGLTVTYPPDGDVLPTLYAVARKAARIGCGGERFREWNYRLLLDGADEYRYGDAYFVLYDKLHTQADRAFVEAFHQSLLARGFVHGIGGANEGPGVRYYATAAERDRRAPCAFSVISDKGTLLLQLRLRAPDACADYLAGCPETVKAMFRTSDPGCGNAGCRSSVRYVFEGEEKRKCGCCRPPFVVTPRLDDVPHYLRLVELGGKSVRRVPEKTGAQGR